MVHRHTAQPELPAKYYLDHFFELIGQLRAHSQHLFSAELIDYLTAFEHLSEAAQCLYLRIASRKADVVRASTLSYQEIGAIEAPLAELMAANLAALTDAHDLSWILPHFTKADLLALLDENGLVLPRSRPKAELVTKAIELAAEHQLHFSKGHNWIKHTAVAQLGYLTFLYFGDAGQRLNQFSLRDLGVRRTRGKVKGGARFESAVEALSAYQWARAAHSIKALQLSPEALAEALKQMSEPVGQDAEARASECHWIVGKHFVGLPNWHAQGMTYLQRSQHPNALEKWLRERYRLGEKEQVKQELEQLMAAPNDPELLMFAEDFYRRKYQGKRLSTATDWLRNHSQTLVLDPAHKNAVEKGVRSKYRRAGLEAVAAENQPWRALFALTFWDLLFETADRAVTSEFDRVPRLVRENALYRELGPQVDARLGGFTSPQQWFMHLTQVATQHYGKGNGMFRWHQGVLSQLKILLHGVSIEALQRHLLAMAKDFQGLKDGYPDLMVKTERGVHFEEVKAPGDQIRRNQATTLQSLERAGVPQSLTRVEWGYDPEQAFVVVDVETTGGPREGHRITEVGMVTVVGERIVDEWSSLVNPQRGIPASITRLTGINDGMVANAPVFAELMEPIQQRLQDAIFVAHNVGFDAGFFELEFARLERRFRMPRLCTRDETKRIQPDLDGYGLAKLCQRFQIGLDNHHRALDDARAAAQLLVRRNRHLLEYGV